MKKFKMFIILLLMILMVSTASYFIVALATKSDGVSISGELNNTFYQLVEPKRFLGGMFKNPKRTSEILSPSKSFQKKYDTIYHDLNGNEMITAGNLTSRTHILFLHGGAYIVGKNGMKDREKLIGELIDNIDCKVTYIDYPVAPESTYIQTIEAVDEAYRFLIQENPGDEFIFMGDSAGGGLALAYSLSIIETELEQPKKMVLFSPWLDLSMSNPEIEDYLDKDMLLDKDLLEYAAQLYTDNGDLYNPLVSPMYANFEGVTETLILFGTDELFYPDAIKLEEKLARENLGVTFSYYEEMQHVWVLSSIKEANDALEESFTFIRD